MIRDLYFVQLTVADWRAALAWYRDSLGLDVLLTNEADGFVLNEVNPMTDHRAQTTILAANLIFQFAVAATARKRA